MTENNGNDPLPRAEAETAAQNDAAVALELRRRTRRSFLVALAAASAGFAGWRWLKSRPEAGGIPGPLRSLLGFNQRLGEGLFDPNRQVPELPDTQRSRPGPRVNGDIGLNSPVDLAAWRLRIAGQDAELTLRDLKTLPEFSQTTPLNCIEGWTTVARWTGVRLIDLADKFFPGGKTRPYFGLTTPTGDYFVDLDAASAFHPQTLLCYAVDGKTLSLDHGPPAPAHSCEVWDQKLEARRDDRVHRSTAQRLLGGTGIRLVYRALIAWPKTETRHRRIPGIPEMPKKRRVYFDPLPPGLSKIVRSGNNQKIQRVLIFPEFLGLGLKIIEPLDQSGEDFGGGVEHRPGLGIGSFPGVGTQVCDQPDHLALKFLGVMELGAGSGRIHGAEFIAEVEGRLGQNLGGENWPRLGAGGRNAFRNCSAAKATASFACGSTAPMPKNSCVTPS